MRIVVALALLLAGCSKPGAPGSCYRERDNACVEFDGAHAAGGERLCAGFRWTAGTCPKENRLGSCTKQGQSEWLYGGAPNSFTPASARSICEGGGGTFTPWSR
jgi:hypothetical protein